MTTWNTFLSTVLPQEELGWYHIGHYSKDGKKKIPFFMQTIAEAEVRIQELLDKKLDVYFGCSKFITNENRKAINAGWQKAYWLDLDCGKKYVDEGKGYLTQAEALMDMKRLCKELGLPKPHIINSGNGIHVYWVLDEAIDSDEWKATCVLWKAQLKRLNIFADPSRVSDLSSVLRVPDTLNFKSDPPTVVKWEAKGTQIAYADFKAKMLVGIESMGIDLSKPPRRPLDETTRRLMGNNISNFGEIMKTAGCPQLSHFYKNQATISYDEWRAGLSIAQFCEDRSTAIHKLSKNHPEYSFSDTENKANDIGGPYLCATIEEKNPGGCDGCPNKGKVTSPINISKKIAKATQEDNIVTLPSVEIGKEVEYVIPEFPFPYYRGKYGGVYKTGFTKDDGEEVEKDALIYKYDLYVVKRMNDPELGDMTWMRVHMPKDGVREFACSNQSLMSPEKFKDTVSKQGVIGSQKEMAEIMQYITCFVKELQDRETAERMRTQFGWCDEDKVFVIGDREITAEGIRYSPPSNATLPFVHMFKSKGTSENWKEVIDVYARPGNEARAFLFFAGLGAPLLRYTNQKGLIFSITENESGTGKTTIQRVINSIWGHPTDTMLIADDTMKAQFHQMGVYNNIAVCTDEVTNMENYVVSKIAYAVSQGRSNNRMKANSNEMRVNNTKWELPAFFSGNSSMHDKMAALKATAESEQLRIVEIEISRDSTLEKDVTDRIFDHVLMDNYGHIGPMLMEYLVPNIEASKELLLKTQKAFDTDARLSQKQRFYSAGAAMAFTGAIIGKQLGLHNIDIDRVWAWAIAYFTNLKDSVKPAERDPIGALGAFLNEHNRNLLVVDNTNDKRTGLTKAPMQVPYGPLITRYEPDTKYLYITLDVLRKWCTERQTGFKGIIDGIRELDPDSEVVKKAMAKGTELSTPPVSALRINLSKVPIDIAPATNG